MFKVIKNNRYLYVSASGKLTHEDYIKHLIPALEAAIEQHGKLNLLIEVKDFNGFELKAAWDDLKFGIQHRKDFKHVAIVGEHKWQEVCTRFFSLFINATVKYFDITEKSQATSWLNKGNAHE